MKKSSNNNIIIGKLPFTTNKNNNRFNVFKVYRITVIVFLFLAIIIILTLYFLYETNNSSDNNEILSLYWKIRSNFIPVLSNVIIIITIIIIANIINDKPT